MKISGILMIIAGFAAILFGGFSYKSHDQVPDMGLIQVVDTEYHPVRIPPFWAWRALDGRRNGFLPEEAAQISVPPQTGLKCMEFVLGSGYTVGRR